MADAASRVVNVLRSHGVKKGDRVFIQVGRLPEWWETMLACLKMGAVAMPGTVMLTPKDIALRHGAVGTGGRGDRGVDRAEVRRGARQAGLGQGLSRDRWPAGRVARLPRRARQGAGGRGGGADPRQRPGAPLLHLGHDRLREDGAPHAGRYGIGHVVTARYWLDLAPEDLHWNISDTGWAKAAWSSFFAPWIAGAALLVHDPTGAFSGKRVLDILAQYPITSCAAPPRSSGRSCWRTSGSGPSRGSGAASRPASRSTPR